MLQETLSEFKVVILLKERKKNKVDLLLERISDIRLKCDHDFRLLNPINLKESLVKGVFLADDKNGPRTFSYNMRCLKCSVDRSFHVTEFCPRCLGTMVSGRLDHPREKYHGAACSYHASRIYKCSRCKFTLVADEWDQ